jgi:hypothetical protein
MANPVVVFPMRHQLNKRKQQESSSLSGTARYLHFLLL